MSDPRVPGFLGRILDPAGDPVGTCFQVSPGVLVTAWHVLDDLGVGEADSLVAFDALAGGAAPAEARVVRTDPVHDLAVLTSGIPLPDTVGGVALTDRVPLQADVVVAGVVHVEDEDRRYRWLAAPGSWRSGTTRNDAVPLGRFSSADVLPGMSGGPVLRAGDDAVIGVVSGRYNTADGWLPHTVWVARIEDLLPLLDGVAPPVVHDRHDDGERPEVTGRLSVVPAVDGHAVERPELIDAVVDGLTAPLPEDGVGTVALLGPGGFGKTTLAIQVSARTRTTFPGGPLWVTVGPDTRGPALAGKINDLSARLSGHRPTMSDPEQAGMHLGELLTERAPVLLVVDDVWHADQLSPFLYGAPQCRRLVTTRIAHVVPAAGTRVSVDAMDASQGRALLAASLEDPPAVAVEELVSLTGRMPLLLRLTNAALNRAVRRGASAAEAADRAVRRLRDGGPTAFDVRRPDQRHQAVAATVEASLDQLGRDDRDRYAELAIFPADADVPVDLVALLWNRTAGLGSLDADLLCEDLINLSLASSAGVVAPTVRLHDVLRDYLRRALGPERLTRTSAVFLDAASSRLPAPAQGAGPAPWWGLSPAEPYLWDNLTYHLQEAGRRDELATLVCDLRWTVARLQTSGPVAVEADLTTCIGNVRADALREAIARTAHLLTPVEPAHALAAIVISRLDGVREIADLVHAYGFAPGIPRLVDRWPAPDLPDRTLRRTLEETARMAGCAVNRDGTWLVACGHDRIAIWDLATGRLRRTLTAPSRGAQLACAISPDDTALVTVTGIGADSVLIWDLATGEVRATLQGHEDWVRACAFSPDGDWLVTGSDDDTAIIWDLATATVRHVLPHDGWVRGCAVSPDGTWLATTGGKGTVRIWDAATGRLQQSLTGHRGSVKACAISSDGRWLVSAADDGTARVWEAATWRLRHILDHGHAHLETCVFSPDSTWIAVAGEATPVHLWNAANGQLQATLPGGSAAMALATGADESWLVTAGAAVRTWNVTAATSPAADPHRVGAVLGCAASPDGTWLLTANRGSGDLFCVWDTTSGDVRRRVRDAYNDDIAGAPGAKGAYGVTGCAVSPDGAWVAALTNRAEIEIHDAATLTPRRTLRVPDWNDHYSSRPVSGCAVAPDGTWLAAACQDGRVRIWDVRTGRHRHTLVHGDHHDVRTCAVSPDGRWLVTAGKESHLLVWDVSGDTPRVHERLDADQNSTYRCAFSPDGRWLAAAGGDGTIRLMAADTREHRRTLHGHTGSVVSCAFDLSGGRLASAGGRTLRVWDLGTGTCSAAMRVQEQLTDCCWVPGSDAIFAVGFGGVYLYDLVTR